ncbi:HNH endonuclease [Macrococcus caseolyticus]|uniref:HNH endonuclease n=1 Tax=Macrococcoides caseolyticum TaxID=69966 RepID=UPI0024BC2820|nr:HNH endonuclease [Macrococcus caseolyticus]MDJ1154491.1 HNH endonuclease [Macrococcus caseolyticus]
MGVKGFQKGHKHSEETKRKISLANSKRVYFNCDNCGTVSSDQPSSYNKKKRHFCCRDCYSEFRRTKLPFYEQHSYKGVRKKGESKQVYHRRYCANNPENISHLKARRYARERGAEGSHTKKEWDELKEKFENKCAFCKGEKKLTKDHIIPLSKGGTDYIYNIQPLCRNCNSQKHNKINYIHEHSHLLDNGGQ